MAGTLSLITGKSVALSGMSCMARIRGSAGQLITQASLSTITYSVSDLTNGTTGSSNSVTISTSVFNDLQQDDPRWTKDSQYEPGDDGAWGYNFLFVVPATAFPVAVLDSSEEDPQPDPIRYRIDFVFTPVSGQAFRVPFESTPTRVYA